jgi:probable DNA metabolism protein
MPRIVLARETDWDGWRTATRAHVLAGTPPETLIWSIGATADPLPDGSGSFGVPRALVALAAQAIQARDPDRFDLLYRLVWRAQAGEPVLEQRDDPELTRARQLALAVRAEAHRMRTHLRFLAVPDTNAAPPGSAPPTPHAEPTLHLGWYTSAHFVLEANAQLLAHRFARLHFAILTPDATAHWDGTNLRFAPGLDPVLVPDDAALAAQWHDYSPDILANARSGTTIPPAEALDEDPRPPDRPPIGPVVLPAHQDPALIAAARDASACRRCPLADPATQTVFGEGPAGAPLLFIGEQPGDQEDVIGRPFVGPAGQVLDRALEEAGIDRRTIYITNAVKHFKFTPRGTRRIHQTPEAPEIQVCRFWLDVERVQQRPRLTILMGATAARAVLGRPVTIGRERGRSFRLPDGTQAFITVHPSFILRVPDETSRAREYAALVADLREASRLATEIA